MSTNSTRGPDKQVFSQRASDELDWSYEKKQFGVLDIKCIIRRRFVVSYRWEFLIVVCIWTRPTVSSKYDTTRKNTQRYYTTNRCVYNCNDQP